ncbi:LysR family transcriptional regulator ArgP [Pukyongiella litopenaei]|uniref:LysR family transcriptional regulator ArgP n=1 Tax=Pukyongiella litopenaei TaxID=2605946 RepID=A0A2S0MKX2_9RHOB|nr:LysR family transcriptional regulator ArgP [Pukyongiella litopenaei]AVO36516.1 LysR family transcriptional regulator ArgP [Pukyongiella litopenaei]
MSLDPHQLAALEAILRLGSFDAAATELAVTPPAISQRIRALEERVGTVLVRRTTPCIATSAGARLAKHAADLALLETQLARDLGRGGGPGRLRVAVNADSLATWFVPAMAAAEGMLFDLVIDDQDHSADWLKRGEVSAAVTASGRPVAGCDAFPLGALRYLATASPGFAGRWFADCVDARSLAAAPCLTFNAKDALQRTWMQAQTGKALSPPSHSLPSTHAFVDAARAGLGWGMNPEPLCRPHIDAGALRELVPDAPLDVGLTWQVSRIMAPALTGVTRAVRRAARAALIAP